MRPAEFCWTVRLKCLLHCRLTGPWKDGWTLCCRYLGVYGWSGPSSTNHWGRKGQAPSHQRYFQKRQERAQFKGQKTWGATGAHFTLLATLSHFGDFWASTSNQMPHAHGQTQGNVKAARPIFSLEQTLWCLENTRDLLILASDLALPVTFSQLLSQYPFSIIPFTGHLPHSWPWIYYSRRWPIEHLTWGWL